MKAERIRLSPAEGRQPRPKRKRFWTRRKLVALLVWLVALVASAYIAQGILQRKVNRQLTEAARRATAGRIQEVEVQLSLLRLYDFLKVGGRIAGALTQTGRPVIEELVLEGGEIRLVPLGKKGWKLLLVLERISTAVGHRPVLMTRTEFRRSVLVVSPGTPEELRLEEFSFVVEPSPEQPDSLLKCTLKGRAMPAEVQFEGTLGQGQDRRWLVEGEGSFQQLPVRLLPLLLEQSLPRGGLSGRLSARGRFRYAGSRLEIDAIYSGSELQFNPQGIPPSPLRRVLESLAEEREREERRFRLSVPLDDPRVRWEEALLEALSQSSREGE